jgi:hypothetical protein
MKYTLEQLRKTKIGQAPSNQMLIAQAIAVKGSQADILRMGAVGCTQLQRDKTRALDSKRKSRQDGPIEVVAVVTIIRLGYKEFDDDNLSAGCKPLRDAIAATLGVDDGDKRIWWRYAQALITDGRTGTIVKIDQV